MSKHIDFISAGAGSGKTYRLTQQLKDELLGGSIHPSGVIATTFTRLAAGELKEKAREALIEAGEIAVANQMSQALISTVNGVCGELMKRFSFEAGYSPELQVLEETQAKHLFSQALDAVIGDDPKQVQAINALAYRLGRDDRGVPLWRDDVVEITTAARANNCDPQQMAEFAHQSSESLLAYFPTPTRRQLDVQLEQAIESALAAITASDDTTKTTANYVQALRDAKRSLAMQQLGWPNWIKLSKSTPAKKSQSAAEEVQLITADFEKHPQLHRDIRDYTKSVFELSSKVITHYQQLKAQRGLIDFIDQELMLYHLLENPVVRETISEELQLLMVDEFQDTSPIQLAVFTRLAELADKVVWVGDIKQAIYGFRGSDPELMQAVVNEIDRSGGSTEVLGKSWRSRPTLVKYFNGIFTEAFANTLTPDKITLEPARVERVPDEPAVAQLQISGNVQAQLASIATSIRGLVESGYQVVDKASDTPRPVRYGDIAILCRSNDRLQTMAAACVAEGVAVSYQRPGLLTTPEAVLAKACLRRLVDPTDTVASAEIRSLSLCERGDEWLSDRLSFLETGQEATQWGEIGDKGLPQLVDLAEGRTLLQALTPKEALCEAITRGQVRETVVKWGPNRQRVRVRLANIDSLLALADKYQETCAMRHIAATVAGLILWLDELQHAQEDFQAVTADDDTVQLVTYHQSKGLEWPVVICHDLNFEPRSRLWGLKVVNTEKRLDIHDPLKGRALRFFPTFFGKQSTGIPVKDRIESSDVGTAANNAGLEEEKRLHYVAFTRARDLLVLPHKGTPITLTEVLGTPWLFPEANELLLPDGTRIPTLCTQTIGSASNLATEEKYIARYFSRLQSEQSTILRRVSPSAAEPIPGAKPGRSVHVGERLLLKRNVKMTDLGTAFHVILAAFINNGHCLSPEAAEAILTGHGVQGATESSRVLTACQSLIKALSKELTITKWQPEFPIRYINQQGQEISGFIDLLLETPDGYVIVDHKAAPGQRSQWSALVEDYSGQLDCYRQAIETLSSQPVLGCWLHLVVSGDLLEIAYPSTGTNNV